MCSIASTGSSSPTMRPTSRAQRPPALTTCSASHRAVLGDDVPGAVRLLGQLDHAVAQHDGGAERLRRLGVGVGGAGRVEMALDRVPERADEVARVHQREHRRRLGGRDDLGVHAEAAALGVGEPQEVHPLRAAGQHHAAGQVQAAGLAGQLLELAVERDGVGLQLGDVGVAVQRVEPARRVPGRARRSAPSARSASRRSSRPWRGGRAPSSRRRRRRSPRRGRASSRGLLLAEHRGDQGRAGDRRGSSMTLKWWRPGSIVCGHVGAEPGPDVGDQRGLPHELRPLAGRRPRHAPARRAAARAAPGSRPRPRRGRGAGRRSAPVRSSGRRSCSAADR